MQPKDNSPKDTNPKDTRPNETTPETPEAGAGPGAQEQRDPAQEDAQALAEKLAEKLAEAERQRDEYLDMAQRLQAEFDNFRRRNNAVRSEAWEDGARETVALMLPVIDNLERALEAAKDKTPLRQGVEMVHKQMLELLAKRGVTVIDRVGEAFDPELENAVMQADPSEGEPGTVCTVLQKGYRTANQIIRHAAVRVVAAE